MGRNFRVSLFRWRIEGCFPLYGWAFGLSGWREQCGEPTALQGIFSGNDKALASPSRFTPDGFVPASHVRGISRKRPTGLESVGPASGAVPYRTGVFPRIQGQPRVPGVPLKEKESHGFQDLVVRHGT